MYKYSNKIDALTAILKRLDSGEKITAEILASDFNVGVRTIYRYLNHLQVAGYPIYFNKDDKSYRFVDNFRLNRLKPGSAVEQFDLFPSDQVTGMAIATFRISGECIHKNMAMSRLTGCNESADCQLNFRLIPWWKECGLLEMADEAIEGGKELCRDITFTVNGRERWIQAHLTPVQRGNDTFLVFLAQDLSPRMQKEMQVARFFAAINNGPGLILVTDTEGVIEYVSPHSLEITGYSPEELIGRKPSLFKSGQTTEETYQNLWSSITSGYTWSGELCNRMKNGSSYWQHLHIAPIRNHTDQICRFVAIMEDVTRQKALEEEIYNYAVSDRITALYNRKIFLELASRDLAAAKRYNRPLTLLLVDLDNFKQFNEQYGYPAGNRILQQLAAACQGSVRNSDLLGRVGKDSIGIILNESTLAASAVVAARILDKGRLICRVEGGEEPACTVSIVGMLLKPEDTVDTLLQRSETALQRFQATSGGGGLAGF